MTDEATVYGGQDIELRLLGHVVEEALVIPGDTPPEGYTLVWEAVRWPFRAFVSVLVLPTGLGTVFAALRSMDGLDLQTWSMPTTLANILRDAGARDGVVHRLAHRLDHDARTLVQDARYYL
jgi:hypothetical protein